MPKDKKSLKETHPNLVDEWDFNKNDLLIENVTYGSKKKVWWLCPKGHSFEARIDSRTFQKSGCFICYHNKPKSNKTDYLSTYPEIAKEWDYEKNDLDPNQITSGSAKKVWWLCSEGHSYKSAINSRTPPTSSGCPFCSGRKAGYGNNLLNTHPNLAKEWDCEKNEIKPDEVTSGSAKKVWWFCKEGHSYFSSIKDRTKGSNCPYHSNPIKKVGYGNDLQSTHPNLIKEWDNKKNSIRPNEITSGSTKKVWWLCKEGHSYFSAVQKRIYFEAGCPYCVGKKVGYGNDLKTNYPEIALEWDYENNTIKPDEVTKTSAKKVWWLCKEGHSYKASIDKRTGRNHSCPYCSNHQVGYGNDLKTNYPDLLNEWDYKKNKLKPNQVTSGSAKKVWWLCNEGHSYSASVSNRTPPKSTQCPYCLNIKIGYGNDLKSNIPNLAKEWDYEKNEIKPDEVALQSNFKVWWVCPNNHSYAAIIANRTPPTSSGCPYCVLTPRSKEEIYLLFELKKFFMIDEDDHKIKINKIYDVDIKLKNEKLIIEYDGSYWHKDKAEKDIAKTKVLQNAGWTVVRIREKPLKILNAKYNISSKPMDYKETANKVLKKIAELGYEVNDLDKYLSKEKLTNTKAADVYMKKLLDEKESKKN